MTCGKKQKDLEGKQLSSVLKDGRVLCRLIVAEEERGTEVKASMVPHRSSQELSLPVYDGSGTGRWGSKAGRVQPEQAMCALLDSLAFP